MEADEKVIKDLHHLLLHLSTKWTLRKLLQ